ncbi:GAF and ANTAR domain-containing protein [Dactylosporangium sp. NPDC050588]|uniref:GAF and ANTAR domain-containing protein n=1 Tax=Dactylosporangium sp. NPDC050588 TaxID=3157211 RepID=UPI0033DA5585
MTTVSEQRLATIFVEVADTLVGGFDLIEFMQMLADRVAGLVTDTTVGLLLADEQDRLHFMAASDETTTLLELLQLQWRDGPCLDAFRGAAPVVNADLSTASPRWPQFARYASSAGFRSVHAFPLRLRDDVIGAMGVFGTGRNDLDDADVQIVQALADVAAIGLLQERAIHHGEVLTEQLQGALNNRIIIEQAKGAVAQAHHVSVDAAFELIRAHARRTHRRLSDVALRVLTDVTSLPDLTAD